MDPIKSPADLKAYFAEIADDLGCSFEYGNSERILNRQLGDLTYPVLWLEVPQVRLLRSGGLKRQMMSAFVVLSDAPVDDWENQDSTLDSMFDLTEQVLQRLQSDGETEPTPFEFDMEGCETEYKQKWSADDDWGWRTEFVLTGAACESADCCD